MAKKRTFLVTQDGELIFEGTIDHWCNCFFVTQSEAAILDYCKWEGWDVDTDGTGTES